MWISIGNLISVAMFGSLLQLSAGSDMGRVSSEEDESEATDQHLPLISLNFLLCGAERLNPGVGVTSHLHVDTEVVSVHVNQDLVGQAVVGSFASFLSAEIEEQLAEIHYGRAMLVDVHEDLWKEELFTRYRYAFRSERSRDWDNKRATIELFVRSDAPPKHKEEVVNLFSNLGECSGGRGIFYMGAAPNLLTPFRPSQPESSPESPP